MKVNITVIKHQKEVNKLSLISEDKHRCVTIHPFGSQCRKWYQIWKNEVKVLKSIFETRLLNKYEIDRGLDFHMGIWDKLVFDQQESQDLSKYEDWKFIIMNLGYEDIYTIWNDKLEKALAKRHIYLNFWYGEMPSYIFFYKKITKKTFEHTLAVCKYLFDQIGEINNRQNAVRDNYLKTYKPWKGIDKII